FDFFILSLLHCPPIISLFPYTTLFRSHEIIRPQIKATKAGLDLSIDELEAHYLAGGNINDIIDALIASERANIALSFEKAAAIDLAGRSVFEAVQVSVNPKVIETPNIAAVAKNGDRKSTRL